MNLRHESVWLLLGLGLVWGCPSPASRTATLPPPPVAAVHIPPGCSANLSGAYVHAANSSFQYQATDDGKTLVLDLHRSAADGGAVGFRKNPSVRLVRGPNGFSGQASGPASLSSGQLCSVVEFPTELVGCDEGGILLRSAAAVRVDETCLSPEGLPAPWAEHRLNRLRSLPGRPELPGDAGSPRTPEAAGAEGGGTSP